MNNSKAVVVLGAEIDGKAHVLVASDGMNAGVLAKRLGVLLGGGGGGSETLGQGGGPDIDSLESVISGVRKFIE